MPVTRSLPATAGFQVQRQRQLPLMIVGVPSHAGDSAGTRKTCLLGPVRVTAGDVASTRPGGPDSELEASICKPSRSNTGSVISNLNTTLLIIPNYSSDFPR